MVLKEGQKSVILSLLEHQTVELGLVGYKICFLKVWVEFISIKSGPTNITVHTKRSKLGYHVCTDAPN